MRRRASGRPPVTGCFVSILSNVDCGGEDGMRTPTAWSASGYGLLVQVLRDEREIVEGTRHAEDRVFRTHHAGWIHRERQRRIVGAVSMGRGREGVQQRLLLLNGHLGAGTKYVRD